MEHAVIEFALVNRLTLVLHEHSLSYGHAILPETLIHVSHLDELHLTMSIWLVLLEEPSVDVSIAVLKLAKAMALIVQPLALVLLTVAHQD